MSRLDGDVGEATIAGLGSRGGVGVWSSLSRILWDQIETELLWSIDRWTALLPNPRLCQEAGDREQLHVGSDQRELSRSEVMSARVRSGRDVQAATNRC
jgi:hypothetical protein